MKNIRKFYIALTDSQERLVEKNVFSKSTRRNITPDILYSEVVILDRLRTQLMSSLPKRSPLNKKLRAVVETIQKNCQSDDKLSKRKHSLESNYLHQYGSGKTYTPSSLNFPELAALSLEDQQKVLAVMVYGSLESHIENYLRSFCN